jgi:hypothetical protein
VGAGFRLSRPPQSGVTEGTWGQPLRLLAKPLRLFSKPLFQAMNLAESSSLLHAPLLKTLPINKPALAKFRHKPLFLLYFITHNPHIPHNHQVGHLAEL